MIRLVYTKDRVRVEVRARETVRVGARIRVRVRVGVEDTSGESITAFV